MNKTLNSLFKNNIFYEEIFLKRVKVTQESIPPNVKLICQGEKYNYFYYIKSGELRVVLNDPKNKKNLHTIINTLEAGDLFGEFVIFNDMQNNTV